MTDIVTRRGIQFLAFTCDCGQRQETPIANATNQDGSSMITCARCGEAHEVPQDGA